MNIEMIERVRDGLEELSLAGEDGAALSPIAHNFVSSEPAVAEEFETLHPDECVVDGFAEPFENAYGAYEVSLTEAMDAVDAVLRGDDREIDAALVSVDAALQASKELCDLCDEQRVEMQSVVDAYCDRLREAMYEAVGALAGAAEREAAAYHASIAVCQKNLRDALD